MKGTFALTRHGHGSHARWQLIRLDDLAKPQFDPADTQPTLRLLPRVTRAIKHETAYDYSLRRAA